MQSKRILGLLAAVMLLLACVTAHALPWPNNMTQGQLELQSYVNRVNENLDSLGRPRVNSLFECYAFNASLGATGMDDAEIPEGVELTFTLYGTTLNTLVLRVNHPDAFTIYATACIQATSPHTTSIKEAQKAPAAHIKKAQRDPYTTIEDKVDVLNGPAPRTYYAYYPDQYHDGVSWYQMTLIFPLAGFEEAGVAATPAPAGVPNTDDVEYGGYFSEDGFNHFEIFTTPTPEPDSAVYDR